MSRSSSNGVSVSLGDRPVMRLGRSLSGRPASSLVGRPVILESLVRSSSDRSFPRGKSPSESHGMLGSVDPSCCRGFPTLFPLDSLAISPERRPDRPKFPSMPRGSAPGAVAAEEAGTDVEVGVDAEAG